MPEKSCTSPRWFKCTSRRWSSSWCWASRKVQGIEASRPDRRWRRVTWRAAFCSDLVEELRSLTFGSVPITASRSPVRQPSVLENWLATTTDDCPLLRLLIPSARSEAWVNTFFLFLFLFHSQFFIFWSMMTFFLTLLFVSVKTKFFFTKVMFLLSERDANSGLLLSGVCILYRFLWNLAKF